MMVPGDVVRRKISLPETGVDIALQDWGGDGPLALLHHANGFCAGMWVPFARALRTRYRVVAMDARGAGDSPPPPGHPDPSAYSWREMVKDARGVAETLLSETGASRLGLGLGHSFGGTLLLSAEAQRPGLFERLLALDPVIPSVGHSNPEAPPSAGLLMAERARRRRSEWPSRAAAREHFASRDFFKVWDAEALDLYCAEGLREREDGGVELKCSPEAEAAIFSHSGGFDVFQTLSGLSARALLVWARQGNFPRAVFEQLVATMKNGRLEEVDAGHLIPMEAPKSVLEVLERFLAED
jgi:pimeloyl-ACP methyl ester carboxylesterase